MKTILPVLLVLSTCGDLTSCARILGMLPMWARSHHRFLQPVLRTLAEAGHEVVVYSPFPLHHPPHNYTNVHLANIVTESEDLTKFFIRISQFPQYMCFDAALHIYKFMYHQFFSDPKIKQLLASKEKFDLIITEAFTAQEYTLVLAEKFDIPVIALQAFPTNHIVNSRAGNSLSISFIPGVCASYSDKMSFFQRIMNTFTTIRDLYNYYNILIKDLDEMMRKDFPDAPPLEELIKRVALTFANDHLTADYAQPRTPNIIPVGGLHIQPTQPLPQEIKEFMEGAKDGVILFSLGTYVQDELLPQQYFDMYNNVFKTLKQRVIWKTRKENIEGLPGNVMPVKWAPQQDILAHPKCVLFITHGGLLSQHEAIHFGVPVVGIPQFYDQYRNVRFYQEQGVGVQIENGDLTEKNILSAVREVLDNSSYRDNMKRMSAIFRDRPLSPAESVVFWTEYVLRHNGAAHLRPASTELTWYQAALLDIAISVLALIFICSVILFYFIRKSISFFCQSNKTVVKNKRKVN